MKISGASKAAPSKKLRDIANALLFRFVLVGLRLRLWLQISCRLVEQYQPIPFAGPNQRASARLRQCQDRFEAMSRVLPQRPLSVLDIGCNIGYFTFSMAQRGGFCLGIDVSRNDLMVAQALATLHQVGNVAFSELRIEPENASTLPRADVVICLSVFHHWVHRYGEETASKIMRGIADSACRYLVFETGQPEEKSKAWASSLEFMTPDSDNWTRCFLTELGFANVALLGEFDTSVSPVPRRLYLAERLTAS